MYTQRGMAPQARRRVRAFALGAAATVAAALAGAGWGLVGAASVAPHGIGAGAVYSMDATGIVGGGGTGGPGSIEVNSFSFGARNIGSQSSSSGAGKVTFNPFSITRKIDAASPIFMKDLHAGAVIATVTLYVTGSANPAGAAGDTFTATFEKVRVTSISWSSSSGGDSPQESITLSARSVAVTYTPAG